MNIRKDVIALPETVNSDNNQSTALVRLSETPAKVVEMAYIAIGNDQGIHDAYMTGWKLNKLRNEVKNDQVEVVLASVDEVTLDLESIRGINYALGHSEDLGLTEREVKNLERKLGELNFANLLSAKLGIKTSEMASMSDADLTLAVLDHQEGNGYDPMALAKEKFGWAFMVRRSRFEEIGNLKRAMMRGVSINAVMAEKGEPELAQTAQKASYQEVSGTEHGNSGAMKSLKHASFKEVKRALPGDDTTTLVVARRIVNVRPGTVEELAHIDGVTTADIMALGHRFQLDGKFDLEKINSIMETKADEAFNPVLSGVEEIFEEAQEVMPDATTKELLYKGDEDTDDDPSFVHVFTAEGLYAPGDEHYMVNDHGMTRADKAFARQLEACREVGIDPLFTEVVTVNQDSLEKQWKLMMSEVDDLEAAIIKDLIRETRKWSRDLGDNVAEAIEELRMQLLEKFDYEVVIDHNLQVEIVDHGDVSEEEAKSMVNYLLSLRKDQVASANDDPSLEEIPMSIIEDEAYEPGDWKENQLADFEAEVDTESLDKVVEALVIALELNRIYKAFVGVYAAWKDGVANVPSSVYQRLTRMISLVNKLGKENGFLEEEIVLAKKRIDSLSGAAKGSSEYNRDTANTVWTSLSMDKIKEVVNAAWEHHKSLKESINSDDLSEYGKIGWKMEYPNVYFTSDMIPQTEVGAEVSLKDEMDAEYEAYREEPHTRTLAHGLSPWREIPASVEMVGKVIECDYKPNIELTEEEDTRRFRGAMRAARAAEMVDAYVNGIKPQHREYFVRYEYGRFIKELRRYLYRNAPARHLAEAEYMIRRLSVTEFAEKYNFSDRQWVGYTIRGRLQEYGLDLWVLEHQDEVSDSSAMLDEEINAYYSDSLDAYIAAIEEEEQQHVLLNEE